MSNTNPTNGFATIDHAREARQGFPEVIFAAGKTAEEVALIAAEIFAKSGRLLATRANQEQFESVLQKLPEAQFNARSGAIYILPQKEAVAKHIREAKILVVSAGTSDLPISEEAAITLSVAGIEHVERIYDVGVAGIHRLMERSETLSGGDIIIVCAGMEGALPSVVGGLVRVPVIAVPTSVGYGASFGGLAALLGMLNSCASGLTVVNIDNGFGAAMAAFRMLSLRTGSK